MTQEEQTNMLKILQAAYTTFPEDFEDFDPEDTDKYEEKITSWFETNKEDQEKMYKLQTAMEQQKQQEETAYAKKGAKLEYIQKLKGGSKKKKKCKCGCEMEDGGTVCKCCNGGTLQYHKTGGIVKNQRPAGGIKKKNYLPTKDTDETWTPSNTGKGNDSMNPKDWDKSKEEIAFNKKRDNDAAQERMKPKSSKINTEIVPLKPAKKDYMSLVKTKEKGGTLKGQGGLKTRQLPTLVVSAKRIPSDYEGTYETPIGNEKSMTRSAFRDSIKSPTFRGRNWEASTGIPIKKAVKVQKEGGEIPVKKQFGGKAKTVEIGKEQSTVKNYVKTSKCGGKAPEKAKLVSKKKK